MFADGNVDKKLIKFILSVHTNDLQHLEKFRDFVSPGKNIEKIINRDIMSVVVHSTEMCKDLINLGCVPHKSLILKAPTEEIVPNNMIHHFIRGMFDGDGCAHMPKKGNIPVFYICGTESIVTYCREQIKKETGAIFKSQVRQVEDHLYGWTSGCRQDIQKIYNYLYEDATIFLDRKRIILHQSFQS